MCCSNLRQLALVAQTFHDVNNRLPPGHLGPRPHATQELSPTAAQNQSLGCLAYLLPYMEQTGASSLITTDMTVDPVKPWWCGDPPTVTASKTRVRSFLC